MQNFSKLIEWLKTIPVWLRSVVLLLVAALLLCLSLVSCGTLNRTIITTQGNDSVQVTTEVSKRDSSSVQINVNPTLHLQK